MEADGWTVGYDADGLCISDSRVRCGCVRAVVSFTRHLDSRQATKADGISLCVFCIRKRQRTTALPPRKPAKKPALRRAEARERLRQVTAVSDVTDAGGSPEQQHGATFDEGETAQVDAAEREQAQADATAHEQAQPTAPAQVDSSSIREREWSVHNLIRFNHARLTTSTAQYASQPYTPPPHPSPSS